MATQEAADILVLRQNLADTTGVLLGNIGTKPDESHLSSGGYHVGAIELAVINAVGRDDYSIRQPRDRGQYNRDLSNGLSYSAAVDMDDDWPRGGRAAWIRWNNLIRYYAGRSDSRLTALRGFNYTPDGTTKRRFDCLTDHESSTTDTVTWHTHLEFWRDLRGTDTMRWTCIFLVQLADAAINHSSVEAAIAAIDAPPPGRKNMQFWSVTAVPVNTTDIYGNTVVNNSRMGVTPKGPFCYLYGEIIDAYTDAPKQTIVMTWPRFLQLCQAWAPVPLDTTTLAQQIAAAYPVDQINEQTIIDALTSEAGHDAFVTLMDQDEVKAILAEEAEQGIKNL